MVGGGEMADFFILDQSKLDEGRLYNPNAGQMPYLTIGTKPFLLDYATEQGENGIEYLRFETTVHDENIDLIRCEAIVVESLTGRKYVVKSVDRQDESVSVECQLDMTDFMGKGLTDTLILQGATYYQNNHYRIDMALSNIFRAAGWKFTWRGKVSEILFYSELSDEYTGTPYNLLLDIMNQVDIVFVFDQKRKRCTAFDPYAVEADEKRILNEKINLSSVDCKSSSYDLVTRIFPLGNNLDVAPVNSGKYYVDNFSYTDRIIAAEWGCTDYSDNKGLLNAAKRYIRKHCVPQESFSMNVIDLYSINDNEYPYLDFHVGDVAFYYDSLSKKKKRMQVTRITRYPNKPEDTEIELTYRADDAGVLRDWKDAG